MFRAWLAALITVSLVAAPAAAHGIWGHVHVTGWAVENMPDDELRAFLHDDPEVFNALLFGAVFADTGYSRDIPASRAYSEHAHWEPFIEDYIQWMVDNDPPPWTTLESKKRVAFLMGVASHGLQDSIFDSLFLHQVEQRDGAGQSETDPGTDGFLAVDGHLRFVPQTELPMPLLLQLFEAIPEDVTQEVIEDSVGLTTAAYVNGDHGWAIAETFAAQYEDDMPWGRDHYMDPAVPGSLRAEIFPTMKYQQAIWARLHGEFGADDVAVFAFPETPRRLPDGDTTRVDSWVTLIFGEGVRYDGVLTALLDDDGNEVPFSLANTRWGADHTRLVRLQPDVDLEPGGWYTARLEKGAELIGGGATKEAWELTFQVACVDATDPACPDLGAIEAARTDGVLAFDPEPNGQLDDDKGCGCAQGSNGGPAGWLALGLLPLVLRHRNPHG